jgi:hypothetical protein
MSGRKTIGFTFNVSLPKEIKGKPTKRSVYNSFDHIGDLVSLDRISGESNIDYKARIYDKTVHLGGVDYGGILNEISRDFGMIREQALIIELKTDIGGSPLAASPNVEILTHKVVLYSDWRPNGTRVVDKEIRIYNRDDSGYYLSDLAEQINESTCFSASLVAGTRPNSFSSCLVRTNSIMRVPVDYVPAEKLIKLEQENIILNSLEFDEKGIYKTEVFGVDPSASGEYRVDYINGTVLSYNTPSGDYGCGYHYVTFPLYIDMLPIQLFSLQDDNFKNELFEKEILDSGEEINALPTEEGAEIFHQLFQTTKVFWGK